MGSNKISAINVGTTNEHTAQIGQHQIEVRKLSEL